LGAGEQRPSREEVLAELDWTMACAVEHLGAERATRYLRKFYPWYVERLMLDSRTAKSLQSSLQSAGTLAEVGRLLDPERWPVALVV
jgi:tRNA-dihydrouridine synthase B